MAKLMTGLVVSTKMQKTVVVSVDSWRKHPFYKKAVKHTKKYKAHVDNLELKEGDKVKIRETLPISKDKKWAVVEKVA